MIRKILLTGGSGSGKSYCSNKVKKLLEQDGKKVILVSESATEVLSAGLSPKYKNISVIDFQKMIVSLQLSKEKLVEDISKYFDDVIILYDRGVIDTEIYCNKKESEEVLSYFSISKQKVMNNYDMVIFLKNYENFVGKNNNQFRIEKSQEELEKTSLKAYETFKEHQNLIAINAFENINDKVNAIYNVVKNKLEI